MRIDPENLRAVFVRLAANVLSAGELGPAGLNCPGFDPTA